jgi:hypothetical protein
VGFRTLCAWLVQQEHTFSFAGKLRGPMVQHNNAGGPANSSSEPQSKRRTVGQPRQNDKKTLEPTIFLARLYDMVNDPKTDLAIQWSTIDGASAFTIVDNMLLEKQWLPKFYKHSNFTSFVRQLNQYQFRKVEPKRWSFAHESFIKNRPDLLVQITRKRKEFGSAKQNSSKKAATGTALDERASKLEACVKQLNETLSRVIEQQVEMQTQLNALSERIGGSSNGQPGEVKTRENDLTIGMPPPDLPWGLLNPQASVVEFADVDIPADIDSFLSCAKQMDDEKPPPPPPPQQPQQQRRQQQLQPQQQRRQDVPPPPAPREHPLQMPRPSTLFQAGH